MPQDQNSRQILPYLKLEEENDFLGISDSVEIAPYVGEISVQGLARKAFLRFQIFRILLQVESRSGRVRVESKGESQKLTSHVSSADKTFQEERRQTDRGSKTRNAHTLPLCYGSSTPLESEEGRHSLPCGFLSFSLPGVCVCV